MSLPTAGPERSIRLKTLPNLRDLGGFRVANGREVRRGQLFRSVQLAGLAGPDREVIDQLGLETVFDLRTGAEREHSPDPDLGAREVLLDVLAGRTGPGPASLISLIGDPEALAAALDDGKGAAMMKDAYSDLVLLDSAKRSYRSLFTSLADGALPALFHCTTGKDRTGWAAASLLLFLGVSREDVYSDYLMTNEELLPALRPMLDEAGRSGIDPDLLMPVLSVDAAYLDTALGLVETTWGSIEGYMAEGLDLDNGTLDRLRERLLTGSP